MKTSLKGISFILSFEKGPKGNGEPSLVMYDAGDTKQIIGWGHVVLPGENYSNGINGQQADEIFAVDLGVREKVIDRLVKVPLLQNQFDALSSYYFNTNSLHGTKLLKYINQGNFNQAALQMDIVTAKGNPNPLPGLINRRNMEKDMFLNGIYKNHN